MSINIIPKNIIVEKNKIGVEYNDHHWCYKGAIVLLIKCGDKIVYRYDNIANKLMLDYDDGEEKFTIFLDKEISVDTTEKKSYVPLMGGLNDISLEEIKEKVKEINHKKAEEEKIINDHQKIIDNHQQIIDAYHNEFKHKKAEVKKIIDDHQKIIDGHRIEINKMNKDMIEINDQFDSLNILNKYKWGVQLECNDMLKLLSKEIISVEYFITNSIAPDIVILIKNKDEQLRKLITDKKININIKNKEEKTLLEISLKKSENFAIFLLKNDIDILPSIKNDVDVMGSVEMNEEYFNNAKRNNHLDLLVTHIDKIQGGRLRRLVNDYIESKKQ
jgi:hypothetical protein